MVGLTWQAVASACKRQRLKQIPCLGYAAVSIAVTIHSFDRSASHAQRADHPLTATGPASSDQKTAAQQEG